MDKNLKKEQLQTKIADAQKNGSIASLYVLEQEVSELFCEDEAGEFYGAILELALERLSDILESHRKMDLLEVEDFATARALYEYAIEHYSSAAFSDAAALFEMLSGMSSDEKFSLSLKIHTFCAQEKMDFDDFLSKVADLDATQTNKTFYISAFVDEAMRMLEKMEQKGEQK